MLQAKSSRAGRPAGLSRLDSRVLSSPRYPSRMPLTRQCLARAALDGLCRAHARALELDPQRPRALPGPCRMACGLATLEACYSTGSVRRSGISSDPAHHAARRWPLSGWPAAHGWGVDLGGVLSVSSVLSFFCTDNGPSRDETRRAGTRSVTNS